MSEIKDVLLMMKNNPVMRINLTDKTYDVLNEGLLPFQLRNLFRKIPETTDNMSRYEINKIIRDSVHNSAVFEDWLASRVLPLSRENAKKIYNLFGFDQLQDTHSKARMSIVCRALSLQDNYWLKLENDPQRWESVNLRSVRLNEAVAQVSLRGTSLSIQNKKEEALRCPELSGQGAYAKAWLREGTDLYLHKTGNKGITESKIEVMVSNLLDNCNVNHLKYEASEAFGGYTCKCKCMTDDTISILPGMDFDSYCNRLGKDPKREALLIDSEMIYKMMIVDYLIANPDRHGMNWGFFYNCETMEILGCHPLFDHNNAFDAEYMRDPDVRYLFDDTKSMRDWAKYAMKEVDFHFYREFTREDFLTDRQYDCFMSRAKEIGVKIIPRLTLSSELVERIWNQMPDAVKSQYGSTKEEIVSNYHKEYFHMFK